MKKIYLLLAFIATFLVGIVIGTNITKGKNTHTIEYVNDTVKEVKIDTIVKESVKPKYITEERTDTLYILNDMHDTITVPIPISEYAFEDSDYSCKVDGYHVELKEMKVYNKTITNTVTIKEKPKHWGVGIQGGYGISKDGLTPYVGVGISYNLFRF